MEHQGHPQAFNGIGTSPGVAIGKVFLLDRGHVRVPRYRVASHQVQSQIDRLHRAVELSVQQLEAMRTRAISGGFEHQSILEAHEMMLRDQALFDEASAMICGEAINAEWAFSQVIARIRTLFGRMPDAYLRERKGDIDFVGERILRNLVGQHADVAEMVDVQGSHVVVVARDLSPADTAVFLRHKVAAFVTEAGSKTSHTSIIARSLEIPAVVGAQGVFDAADSGDLIVVDGLDGAVHLRPSMLQLSRDERRATQYQQRSVEVLAAKALPARTLDGRQIEIAGNIELPSEVPAVIARGGEAIGLYRTEYMYMGRSDLPTEEQHYQTYKQIFAALGSRQITVRTLDVGGDKVIRHRGHAVEPNPALGLRAIRYCLHNRDIFELQIAGLLRAATAGNVRLMLPMIGSLDEILAARQIISAVADRLKRQGIPHRSDLPIGIMVEVPSAALMIDILAAHCDFLSIGTNDLLQYLLACDRINERVAYLYQPYHPAVLRILWRISQDARDANVPISVCGEMAGDVDFLPLMLGYRFSQLSMHASCIPRIKSCVRQLLTRDCQQLLGEARSCPTAADVKQLVTLFMAEKLQNAQTMTG